MTSEKFITKLGKQRGSSTSADVAADVPVAVSPLAAKAISSDSTLETNVELAQIYWQALKTNCVMDV